MLLMERGIRMKIVMIEPLSVPENVIDNLSKKFTEDNHEFVPCFKPLSDEVKLERVKDADILVITNGKLSEELVKAAPNLKMISVGFTGVDHVPASLCIEKGITVSNSQGYATIPTAELSVTLMLMATRNVLETNERCRNGKTKEGLVGSELSHKTVGIVGTGMIGRQVAKLLKGFEVNLLGYDIQENPLAKELGIKYVSLDEIFKQSDFISLHLPLLDSTKGIVNSDLLGLMKETAILVNCARGPIVETSALVNALNDGKIRGAGVDVYEIEPPLPTDHEIFSAKNIVTTPHIAFASKESMERRAEIVFDNIYAYLAGKPINVKF
jgi:D-3-phosphoglycerate dehydrogenase